MIFAVKEGMPCDLTLILVRQTSADGSTILMNFTDRQLTGDKNSCRGYVGLSADMRQQLSLRSGRKPLMCPLVRASPGIRNLTLVANSSQSSLNDSLPL